MRPFVILALILAGIAPAAGQDSWVTIKGRIVYDGPTVAPAELNVTTDQAHCLEKGKLLNETWVVGPDKGVKNVFVWLASDGATGSGKSLPVHPSLAQPRQPTVEVDQPRCSFVPRAIAVREGQTLVVKNSSPVVHNVRWEPANSLKNKAGNETIVSGKQVEIKNLKQDRLPISIACSIHPWMKGYVRVFDSPYYDVTGDDGRFELKLAPAGKWRLFVWHEGSGWKDGAKGKNGEEITVGPAATLDLGELKIKP
jgi:plastocyanin